MSATHLEWVLLELEIACTEDACECDKAIKGEVTTTFHWLDTFTGVRKSFSAGTTARAIKKWCTTAPDCVLSYTTTGATSHKRASGDSPWSTQMETVHSVIVTRKFAEIDNGKLTIHLLD